jgi:hypothetical protein
MVSSIMLRPVLLVKENLLSPLPSYRPYDETCGKGHCKIKDHENNKNTDEPDEERAQDPGPAVFVDLHRSVPLDGFKNDDLVPWKATMIFDHKALFVIMEFQVRLASQVVFVKL